MAKVMQGMLGYTVRDRLYPGEENFFSQRPDVAGMAAEDGQVILNPHSPPGVNHEAVARNVALRLAIRDKRLNPKFAITPQQSAWFQENAPSYLNTPQDMRNSMLGRLYSGDTPYPATDEQRAMLGTVLNMVRP